MSSVIDLRKPHPKENLSRGLKMLVAPEDYERLEAYAKRESYRGVGSAVRALALAALDAIEAEEGEKAR